MNTQYQKNLSNLKKDENFIHNVLSGMDETITKFEDDYSKRIDNLELEISKEKARKFMGSTMSTKSKSNSNFLDVKSFKNSGYSTYCDYTKGLSFDSNAALSEAELNTDIIHQAIANSAALSAFGTRSTENLEYRRTVNTARPAIKLTKENSTFTPINQTDNAQYETIAGSFVKMFSYPWMTTELIDFSDVDTISDIQMMITEDMKITAQQQMLFGTGVANSDGITEIKGVFHGFIDRANAYSAALEPTSTRLRDVLPVTKANAADIGTTPEEIESFLYDLILAIPEQYQATSRFMMNQNTLGFLLQNLKASDGKSLVTRERTKVNGVWTNMIQLYGFDIILNETIDDIEAGAAPIAFGSFSDAVEMLLPLNNMVFVQDPYSLPDAVKYFYADYIGSTVVNNDAMITLVCVA